MVCFTGVSSSSQSPNILLWSMMQRILSLRILVGLFTYHFQETYWKTSCSRDHVQLLISTKILKKPWWRFHEVLHGWDQTGYPLAIFVMVRGVASISMEDIPYFNCVNQAFQQRYCLFFREVFSTAINTYSFRVDYVWVLRLKRCWKPFF